MTVTVELIYGGNTLDISGGNAPDASLAGASFAVLEDAGLGMSPFHRISERGPLQHGDSDRGYLLDPRYVTLKLLALAADETTHFTRRSSLLAALLPGDDPIILRYTLTDGTVRQLDCFLANSPMFAEVDRKVYNFFEGVVLRANDPTLYDPEATSVTFEIGAGGGSFAVPMVVPHEVGASVIDELETITYPGTFLAYPIIRITGPIDDCIITNETTGEVLDFTGDSLSAADYYDVDLRYGRKTIVDSAGASQLGTLTSGSDLATWHLAADPKAPGGINSIRVTGSAATEATQVEISYFTRYIGI